MALSRKKQQEKINLLEDFRADRITRIQFRNRYDGRVERITNDVVRARVSDYVKRIRDYTDSQWISFINRLRLSLAQTPGGNNTLNFSHFTGSDLSIRW